MPVQSQCRRCKHIIAADTPDKLYQEISDCPEGGQHSLGDFEEVDVDDQDYENFSGQIAL